MRALISPLSLSYEHVSELMAERGVSGCQLYLALGASLCPRAEQTLPVIFEAGQNAMPRVMNVDKNPADPAAVEALKADGVIPRRVIFYVSAST